MITAILEAPIGPDRLTVGPESFFIAEGEALKTASGEQVAVHRAGLWQTGNTAYIAVTFETPVQLFFRDTITGGEARFGPFPTLRIVNGSIWVKTERDVQLLAHFSDVNWVWTIYPHPVLKANTLAIRPPE
ncbi:MAG TPA: hypothetical protein VJ809_01060 [Pirellulales bacterium]|jgi:hypothetical protein|nr:hypothetical protein [Pirellulales bacterium]